MSRFAEVRTCYFIDMPGFGRSSRPDFVAGENRKTSKGQDQLEIMLDMILRWCKFHKLTRFQLAGHSFGGYLAFIFASKYHEHIQHLHLLDPCWCSDYKNKKIYTVLKGAYNIVQPFDTMRKSKFMYELGKPIAMRHFMPRKGFKQNIQIYAEYYREINKFVPT